MGNGRGIWDQYYRDSICDKAEVIEELEKKLTPQEPKKATSCLTISNHLFIKNQKRKKR